MVRRIAFAVLISVALAGAGGALAACPPNNPKTAKHHHPKTRPTPAPDGCVNLNTVPQISENIVATERTPQATKPGYTPPPETKYEGPTLGLSKPDPAVKPIPTVGYHWALE
jgi:hypothetical protein